MAAEGLPAGTPGLPGWELDAWYQDLQEVLAAAEPAGPAPPWGAEQAEPAPPWGAEGAGPGGCELDATLAAELLELLGPGSTTGTEAAGPPHAAPSSSSGPATRWGAGEEEEAAAAAATGGRGVKRRRERAEPPERAGERRVLELTAQNEQLRAEIQRLSAEVQRTRAALIDRIVNLRRA